LVLIADIAAFLSASLSHLDPLRVLPERRLPADWSLPEHWPAHEEVPGGREHRHVGADLGEDVLRAARLDPGQRAQHLNLRLKRAQLLLDRLVRLVDQSQAERAQFVRMADRYAGFFLPATLVTRRLRAGP
jgi:hypothetical protein